MVYILFTEDSAFAFCSPDCGYAFQAGAARIGRNGAPPPTFGCWQCGADLATDVHWLMSGGD